MKKIWEWLYYEHPEMYGVIIAIFVLLILVIIGWEISGLIAWWWINC